jgi:hypothetical protein
VHCGSGWGHSPSSHGYYGGRTIEAMARHIKLYISPWEREPHLCDFAITFSAWSSGHGAGITALLNYFIYHDIFLSTVFFNRITLSFNLNDNTFLIF